jgi:site-specific DNA-cytosine methylase
MDSLVARGPHAVLQPIALAENTIGRQPQNGGNGDGFTDGGPMYTLNATGVHGVAQPIAYNISPGKGALKEDIHVTDAYATKTLDASASNPAMHQGGTAIVQPICLMDQGGSVMNIEHDMTGTLRRETHGHEPIVMQPIGVDTYNGTETGQVSCTITADVGGPTHSGPKVMQSIASSDQMAWSMNLMSPGRKVREDHGVGALTQQCHSPTQGNEAVVIQQAMAVRRLTPVECERLQGFSDNYTNIKSKGKPTPDGPRYKALGNSMAVPVMAWIGARIQQYEDMQ